MDISFPSPVTFAVVALLARLVFGLLFAAHGTQKLFGWFRGAGLADTAAFFEQIGFRPGRAFAFAAGLTEFTSGMLLALGFLGPVAAAMLLSVMVVAVATVHRGNGLLATSNGSELPILYATGAVSLTFLGFGPFSLDAWLGVPSAPSQLAWALLVGGVLSGFANVLGRHASVARRARGSAIHR